MKIFVKNFLSSICNPHKRPYKLIRLFFVLNSSAISIEFFAYNSFILSFFDYLFSIPTSATCKKSYFGNIYSQTELVFGASTVYFSKPYRILKLCLYFYSLDSFYGINSMGIKSRYLTLSSQLKHSN